MNDLQRKLIAEAIEELSSRRNNLVFMSQRGDQKEKLTLHNQAISVSKLIKNLKKEFPPLTKAEINRTKQNMKAMENWDPTPQTMVNGRMQDQPKGQ